MTNYEKVKKAYMQHYFNMITDAEYIATKRGVNGLTIISAIKQARIELRAMGQFVFIN